MSALHVWQGDILGGEKVSGTPLVGANPLRLGLSRHGLPLRSECPMRVCGFSAGKLHCVRLLQSRKGVRVAWSLFLLALEIGSEQESASQTGR